MSSNINEISNNTIVRILAIIVAFVIAVFLIVTLRQPLVWVGIAFFFALALERPVDWLSSKLPRKSRGLAVLIVVAGAILGIAYFVSTIAPPLFRQFSEMLKNLPGYYSDFLSNDNPVSDYLAKNDISNTLSLNGERITNFFTTASGGVVNVFTGIFSSIFAFFTIIVFTFFMVLEWPKFHDLFWRYQDPSKRSHRKHLYSRMQKTVSGYIGGNLLTSLVAGATTLIFLLLLKNPYAFSLAFTVAVLDLIPMFGALLASIIAVSVVLVYGGVPPAIAAAIFFLVYQQIENNILQPYVFSKTVNISPLIAGIAALFGASLGGLVGALVAIPIAASLQILIKDYLERKYPNKHSK